MAAKNGQVEVFTKLLQYGAMEEIHVGKETINVREVALLFKKTAIVKQLEQHKLAAEAKKLTPAVSGQEPQSAQIVSSISIKPSALDITSAQGGASVISVSSSLFGGSEPEGTKGTKTAEESQNKVWQILVLISL